MTPSQQKIQHGIEAAAGATISFYSMVADITDIVQGIGVWCGAIIAIYGVYGIIKKEYKNYKNKKSK